MMEFLFFDNPSPLSLFVAMVAFFLAVFYFVHNKQACPPGPVGLPYLGIWPFLEDNTAHLKMDEYTRKYGDVSSFTSMGRMFINLGSIKAVREAHVTKADCFADRVVDFMVLQDMLKNGLLDVNGEEWKTQRKFFLQSMKERGVKAITDTRSESVTDVMQSVIKDLRDSNGQAVPIVDLLTRKCTSTLRLTLFGEEGLTDERVKEVIEPYELVFGGMTPTNLLLVGNFAKYFILPLKSEYRLAKKNHQKVSKLLQAIVDEHRATYNEDNIRDVIDEFIRERNSRQKKRDPTAQYFNDKALVGNLVQFVGDGVLAVSFVTSAVIRSLVEHPEEQEKIHKEIAEVVGSDRLPTMEDKASLPYLSAFILEVLRRSDVFSLLPVMECTKETTLRGYKIPKGAITMLNFWSAHNDPETYQEPQKFDPSRFLSRDGKKRADLPITFGMGKRSCLGEGFAMSQIFLFLSAIVKNFKLSVAENEDTTLFELLLAGKLKIRAQPRT